MVSVDDSKIVLDFKYEIFEFFYNETQRLFTNDFVGNIRREKGTSEKGIFPRTIIVGTGRNFRSIRDIEGTGRNFRGINKL